MYHLFDLLCSQLLSLLQHACDQAIYVLNKRILKYLGGALGGCGGGWGGRGGGGGGVHSFFGGFFKLGWGLAQFLRQEFKKKPISSKIR